MSFYLAHYLKVYFAVGSIQLSVGQILVHNYCRDNEVDEKKARPDTPLL